MTTTVRGCSFPGCPNIHQAKGYCKRHYNQFRRGRTLAPLEPLLDPECIVDDCTAGVHAKKLCHMHYQWTKGPYDRGECSFEGCKADAISRSLCHGHYFQLRAGRDLKPLHVPGGWGKWGRGSSGYVQRHRDRGDGTYEKSYQHRYVMEQHLGRKLMHKETVHHINGVRDDNRLANLELWSSSHPSGQRVPDKVAWAVEIIKQYQPELLKEEI